MFRRDKQICASNANDFKNPPIRVTGLKCILVDDGSATGLTMRAAIAALRQQSPAKIIVALPTTPPSVYNELKRLADDAVALMTPFLCFSVSRWYTIFGQTSDEEVQQLYKESKDLKEFRDSAFREARLGVSL